MHGRGVLRGEFCLVTEQRTSRTRGRWRAKPNHKAAAASCGGNPCAANLCSPDPYAYYYRTTSPRHWQHMHLLSLRIQKPAQCRCLGSKKAASVFAAFVYSPSAAEPQTCCSMARQRSGSAREPLGDSFAPRKPEGRIPRDRRKSESRNPESRAGSVPTLIPHPGRQPRSDFGLRISFGFSVPRPSDLDLARGGTTLQELDLPTPCFGGQGL
jgi:hypothetical protein